VAEQASRFTEKQHTALAAYAKYILDALLMPYWELRLLEATPAGNDSAAEIKTVFGRRVAELYLEDRFFDNPPDRLEHYILHELCHLVTEDLDSVVRNGPPDVMGGPATNVFEAHWKWQLELVTDQMAYWLQPMLARDPAYVKLRDALTGT